MVSMKSAGPDTTTTITAILLLWCFTTTATRIGILASRRHAPQRKGVGVATTTLLGGNGGRHGRTLGPRLAGGLARVAFAAVKTVPERALWAGRLTTGSHCPH